MENWAMAKWRKSTHRLNKDHQWRAKPGYNVFVADRGAVRFDIPRDWVIIPGPDAIKFYDRQPPDDDCILQMTLMRLNPEIDWSGLPLRQLFEATTGGDHREVEPRGEVNEIRRQGVELVWQEFRFIDENEHREAYSRSCLARSGILLPLLTLDFWPEDLKRIDPVWNEVLRSLRLGEYIEDPRRGARYGYG
jgi:hypothetical protein